MISDQLKAQVISVTPELATEWLARGGVNRRVSQKHVMRLAESTARQKMTQTELLALFIKAWNYWRVGREVQQLVWKYRAGEEFPEVQGDVA